MNAIFVIVHAEKAKMDSAKRGRHQSPDILRPPQGEITNLHTLVGALCNKKSIKISTLLLMFGYPKHVRLCYGTCN